MQNEKFRINPKKILAAVLIVLAVLIATLAIAIWAMFGSEISSILTIERIDGKNLYTMNYKGDYGFENFLEQGGASSDEEVVDFVVDMILGGIPLKLELHDLGCSTILVENEDGGYLFGRNFDMYDSPAMLVYTEPDDGYKSISMVNLAYIGYSSDSLPKGVLGSINTLASPYAPIDGVNEKGLCISVMLIETDCTNQDRGLADITTTTAIRLVLDKAATVSEAVELLSQYDMHSSAGSCYHFLIADADGSSAVVEYIDDEMGVVESSCSTNFLLAEGDWDFGGGYDRFDILAEEYESSGGVMSSEKLTEVMASVAQTGENSTQWTCIYDMSNLTVTIYYQMDYENAYTFSLSD